MFVVQFALCSFNADVGAEGPTYTFHHAADVRSAVRSFQRLTRATDEMAAGTRPRLIGLANGDALGVQPWEKVHAWISQLLLSSEKHPRCVRDELVWDEVLECS